MRILIVTPIFSPRTGGPATYVWELAARLKKTDAVTIVCFSPQPKRLRGVKVIGVSEKGNFLSRQLNLARSVYSLGRKVDLFYIQGPLVVGFISSLVGRLLGKKVVLKYVGDEAWESAQIEGLTKATLEDYLGIPKTIKEYIWIELERLSLRIADVIVVPANYLKMILRKFHHLPADKIRMIVNAVEVFPATVKKKRWQLVVVARLVPWKNIDQVIKAVALAREKFPWRLVIIGEGPEEFRLKTQARRLKGDRWIIFKGRRSLRQTLKEVAQAEALILYSSYEGLSHTVLEALQLGTRVIVSDQPALKDLVNGYGRLVPLNSLKALAEMINSEDVIVEGAFEYVKRIYSWEKHLKTLEGIWSLQKKLQ
ncbi:hypothetical protein A3A66_00675 [Microgenomates group bacterium RIFCSPLOWO2_01_FULL_46_13]|nr:MAG: hypothetical protein A2783_02750 [Microgenomates group bacterium RIFCSPHIGHO2_01_FULL_45_11]OGV94524.1 MAG: hypothetical protein A3A66_00675 [Microgenomates group bacterium RIFCSPLOWO2_01_FULL_46_13]